MKLIENKNAFSRMCTVHYSGHLMGGSAQKGVCLGGVVQWGYLPGEHLPIGSVCPRVSGQGVSSQGVSAQQGLSTRGRCLPKGCVLRGCLPRGMSAKHPHCEQNHKQVVKHYLAAFMLRMVKQEWDNLISIIPNSILILRVENP